MKNKLLATTALATMTLVGTQAMAAEKIQIQVRGYHVGGIALSDFDGQATSVFIGPPAITPIPDVHEVNFGSDSEIHFRGSTTLDNGLEVSFRAELELENDSDVSPYADQIDEVYVELAGGFGRVQLGQNDGAGYQMHIAAPNTFIGHGVNQADAELDPFEVFGGNTINTYSDLSGDHIKLTYFTPSFNGLQFGASWTPNPCKNDTGYSDCVDNTWDRNHLEVAATWIADMGNSTFGISAAYGIGDDGSAIPGGNPTEWTIGAELGFGGFTFGGSYRDADLNDFSTQNHWDIGATYETGPWGLTAQYGESEFESTFISTNNDEFNSWLLGATYMYGPGMQIGFGVQSSELYERNSFISTETIEIDGTSFFIENAISF